MRVLEKISSGINRIVTALAMLFLVVLLVSSTAQVVSRYALNASIVWTEELARYCFVWLNLLGASVLVKIGGHAVVDLFSKKLGPGAKRVYQTLINAAILYIGIVFVKYGWQLVTVVKKQKSPAMHISMAYVYSAVMVCGILVCFQAIVLILEQITGYREEEK